MCVNYDCPKHIDAEPCEPACNALRAGVLDMYVCQQKARHSVCTAMVRSCGRIYEENSIIAAAQKPCLLLLGAIAYGCTHVPNIKSIYALLL
uniref:SAP domain-containing protein n=1 Tax=Parascaris univalens TaxID=6257 RepID=A0A915CC06_PARUN